MFALVWLSWAFSAMATGISGRMWDDANRNGIRDGGESGVAGVDIYISTNNVFQSFATNTTDAAGSYGFTGLSNGNYYIWVFPPDKYAFTAPHVGADDTVDSDIENYHSGLLNFTGSAISNQDIGVYELVPGIEMTTRANGVPSGTPLYITNGAFVTFIHTVSNNGETALSNAFIYNPLAVDFVELAYCPSYLLPGSVSTYSTQMVITTSFTNYAEAIAFPVLILNCHEIEGLIPVWNPNYSPIIVVTNNPLDFDDGDDLPNAWEIQYGLDPLNPSKPNANSDSDWMTDFEEYIADTDPTNAASFFANTTATDQFIRIVSTSTSRVYGISGTTNLLEQPQTWTLEPIEQTGTGSAIQFIYTNASPFQAFRANVRLP